MNSALRYVLDEESGKSVIAGTFDNIPPGLFVPFTGYDEDTGMGYITPLSAYNELLQQYTLEGYVNETTPRGYYNFLVAPPPTTIIPFDWSGVPESTMATIMPHQRDAINTAIMEHNGHSIVAAAVGTGKTLIGALYAFYYGGLRLFVVPGNKRKDWMSEIRKWTGTEEKIQVMKSAKDKITCPIVICSYDMVKNHDEILQTVWRCVVVDECHMLKGDSKRSKMVVPMLKKATAVLLLSGTPQESQTAELFNQLHALYPNVFNDRKVFTARYSNGHYDRFNKWIESGSRNLDELHVVLSRCMFRVTSDVIVDLPDIERYRVNIDTKSAKHLEKINDIKVQQQALYEEQRKLTDERMDTIIQNKRNVLGNKLWWLSGMIKTHISKDLIVALIQKHPEENIVFFAHHQRAAEKCHKMLKQIIPEDGRVIVVNADVPDDKRQGMLNPLTVVNKEKPVYGVLSLKTCGTGINLCPGVSVVVFLEMDRNPGQMTQAEGRARRKGAIRLISAYWLVLKQGNDNMNLQRLQTRKGTNARVLDGVPYDQFEFDYTMELTYQPKEGEEEDLDADLEEEEEEEERAPKRKRARLTGEPMA